MPFPPNLAFILDHLIASLAATWPSGGSAEERLAAARGALEALQPGDLAEAMLASRMIAAHHASMDAYRRSLQPGLSDADSSRLRASAVSTGRAADAAQRTLDKRREPPKEPALPRAPRARPTPAAPEMSPVEAALAQFTPEEIAAAEYSLDNDPADLARNELAARIPLDRFEDMTMEERRIAYAPRAPLTPAELAVLGARIAAHNRNRANGSTG